MRLVGDSFLPTPVPKDEPQGAWTVQIAPGWTHRVPEGQEPNRFHRWMQRVCFGLKWHKT